MLVTAAVAGFFFALFVLVCGITPAGDKTWAVFDMKMQYLDFYSYYKTVLAGKNDLFYSPAMTLGSGAVGFFTYYLSSPLLLILSFTDRLYIPEAVTVMNGLKLMLMAALCDGFLRSYFKRRGLSGEKLTTRIFALSYTFCAYMITYSVNPMWLEVFALLPLILWMLDRLITEGKYAGYVISLAAALWFNYYIAYMICIFIVLWTVVCLIREPEGWFRKLLRTGLCSLWAVALTAVAMIPTFLELFGSPKDVALMGEKVQGADLGIKEVFSKAWLLAFDPEQTFWGTPLLYAGSLILLLTILYFLNRKIPLKDKLCAGALLFIFLVSYMLDKLNLMWHAGMEPSGYPYREAFLAIFVCCLCACRAYGLLRDGTAKWHIPLAAVLSLGLFLLTVDSAYPLKFVLAANILPVLLCGLFLFLQVQGKDKEPGLIRRLLPYALVCLQLLELLVGAWGIFNMQTANGMLSAADYRAVYMAMREVTDALPEDAFYRTENMQPREQNDGMMYDYNSLTHYSSAGLVGTREFLKRLGYNDDGLYTAYGSDNTCTADSLLGIRYVIAADNRGEYPLRKEGAIELRENPYALSVASAMDRLPETADADPFTLQERMYESLAGEKTKLFVPLKVEEEIKENDRILSCTTEGEGCVYLYLDGIEDRIQNISVYLNECFRSVYGNLSCHKILNLGHFEKGESFTLRLRFNAGEDMGKVLLVTEDLNALAEAHKKASLKDARVERLSSSRFRITLPAGGGISGLSTTIPYEASWNATVDGRKVEPQKLYDTFLYIPDCAAASVVELSYVPQGLVPGAFISAAALFLLIFLHIRGKKGKKEADKEEKE